MLNLRDKLVEDVARAMNLPYDTVDEIVMWSYRNAAAAAEHSKEIEFSGFGKILISPFKVAKKIAALTRRERTVKEEEELKALKSKI